jgi:hypothetical protein
MAADASAPAPTEPAESDSAGAAVDSAPAAIAAAATAAAAAEGATDPPQKKRRRALSPPFFLSSGKGTRRSNNSCAVEDIRAIKDEELDSEELPSKFSSLVAAPLKSPARKAAMNGTADGSHDDVSTALSPKTKAAPTKKLGRPSKADKAAAAGADVASSRARVPTATASASVAKVKKAPVKAKAAVVKAEPPVYGDDEVDASSSASEEASAESLEPERGAVRPASSVPPRRTRYVSGATGKRKAAVPTRLPVFGEVDDDDTKVRDLDPLRLYDEVAELKPTAGFTETVFSAADFYDQARRLVTGGRMENFSDESICGTLSKRGLVPGVALANNAETSMAIAQLLTTHALTSELGTPRDLAALAATVQHLATLQPGLSVFTRANRTASTAAVASSVEDTVTELSERTVRKMMKQILLKESKPVTVASITNTIAPFFLRASMAQVHQVVHELRDAIHEHNARS